MVYHRGGGCGGRVVQIKMTLDEDAGEGLIAIEDMLISGIFNGQGRRSDVQRILLRHWVEHPPDPVWIKARWKKDLGQGWPNQPSDPDLSATSAELEESPL